MPTSYNTSPGGLMYSPERDFAYNYTRLVACIIRAFNTEHWPLLLETLKHPDTTTDSLWDEVCVAKDAYCDFIDKCCQDPEESVEDVLARSDWNGVSVRAQVAWLAMMGQVMTGQLFQGLRDTTPADAQRPSQSADLELAGMTARRVMNKLSIADDKAAALARLSDAVSLLQNLGLTQKEIRSAVDLSITA